MDFSPPINDYTIPQGSTIFLHYVLKQNNVAFDLTHYNLRCQLRYDYNGKVIIDMNETNNLIKRGATIVDNELFPDDPKNGGFALIFKDTVTAAINFKSDTVDLIYDVELYNTDESVRIMQGVITLSREVTR